MCQCVSNHHNSLYLLGTLLPYPSSCNLYGELLWESVGKLHSRNDFFSQSSGRSPSPLPYFTMIRLCLTSISTWSKFIDGSISFLAAARKEDLVKHSVGERQPRASYFVSRQLRETSSSSGVSSVLFQRLFDSLFHRLLKPDKINWLK